MDTTDYLLPTPFQSNLPIFLLKFSSSTFHSYPLLAGHIHLCLTFGIFFSQSLPLPTQSINIKSISFRGSRRTTWCDGSLRHLFPHTQFLPHSFSPRGHGPLPSFLLRMPHALRCQIGVIFPLCLGMLCIQQKGSGILNIVELFVKCFSLGVAESPGLFVWVKFKSLLTVRLFDIGGRRGGGDTKDLVGIFEWHAILASE
mmetsp:Transcript_23945/g.57772  ORF Transcript_23945/g.57772 Transcript_23945/m.57772 type:complete len:200 (+) Transcript_23945:2057-2656(+)